MDLVNGDATLLGSMLRRGLDRYFAPVVMRGVVEEVRATGLCVHPDAARRWRYSVKFMRDEVSLCLWLAAAIWRGESQRLRERGLAAEAPSSPRRTSF